MPKKIQYFRPAYLAPAAKSYERQTKRKEDISFYHNKRWVKLRALKIAEFPMCERCGAALAQHVHHIKPRKTHPDLAFEYENLESLCIPCHNAEPDR
jgi:5-methylcytosine-specific restriction endonuclease McrA